MIEIFIAIICGILLGIISGITPGLHVNTIGIIIFSISNEILNIVDSLTLCTFFISVAICHAMIEFIPSITMGIPDENTVTSIQPGHRLLFEGKGKKAMRLVSYGGYASILLLIILMPILFVLLPVVYNLLRNYIGYMLVIVMALIIYFTNRNNASRILYLLLFLVSGVLGLFVLNSNLGSNLSLLCMLSGLFSISTLLYSINNSSNISYQKEYKNIVVNNKFKKSVLAGSISGCILGLLPGLGPAQGTIIAQTLTLNKDVTPEEFLITNSGVNISDTLFSIMSIYLIGNPRSAISVYVSNIIQDMTFMHVLFFIFVSLVSVSISCIIAIKIGDFVIDHISKINYKKLTYVIVVFISIFLISYTVLTNGCLWYVILCYITSIALGLLPNVLNSSKSSLMGVLIVPSIIIYLGLI